MCVHSKLLEQLWNQIDYRRRKNSFESFFLLLFISRFSTSLALCQLCQLSFKVVLAHESSGIGRSFLVNTLRTSHAVHTEKTSLFRFTRSYLAEMQCESNRARIPSIQIMNVKTLENRR